MLALRRRPLVSVVLASYNHAPFVEAALGSVLRQQVRDIEVIVVDDGSSDSTASIVARVDDQRVHLIHLRENRRAHPRNVALTVARGHFVAFQNSDDVWHPEKLAMQVDALGRSAGAVACFTGVTVIGESGAPVEGTWANGLFATEHRTSTSWLRRFFEHGNCLCLPSAVVRRRALVRLGGFRGSLMQLGDFDLWVRLAAIGELLVLPDALTCMRVVADRNVSAPSPNVGRRSLVEYADVLGRYVEPPVLSRLHEVFPDRVAAGASATVRAAAVAAYAWTLGAAHRLFADRVYSRLLDDAVAREEVAARLGVGVLREFFVRRGELAIATEGVPP